MSDPKAPYQPPWPPQPPPVSGGTVYGAPPAPPAGPRRRRWLIPAVTGLLVVVGIVVAIVAVRDSGAAPAGTPLVGKDSGVAACEAIAKDNKLAGDNDDDNMTEAEYKALRKQFADSHDAAIRDNGTKIIDLAWQAQGMGDDAGLAMLSLMGDLISAYAGLSGGCAAHGITIPPLTMDTAAGN